MKITHIVTHRNFHHDEAWGMYLMYRFGGKKYEGVGEAIVRFVDDPASVNGDELLKQGMLCIGCGGGMFDEHNRLEADSCAAELVARDLGLMDSRGIRRIIDYARKCDRTSDVRPMELPSLIKMWHKLHPNDPQMVLDRTLDILADILESALEFQEIYDTLKPKKIRFQVIGTERKLTLSVFDTDRPDVQKVARIKGVDIVVIRNSRGNIAVFTDAETSQSGQVLPVADMSEVMRLIRQAELCARGKNHNLPNLHLKKPGTIPEVPQWYYLQSGQMLLNGSDQAAQGVEPTKVSVDDIVQAIKVGTRSFTSETVGAGK